MSILRQNLSKRIAIAAILSFMALTGCRVETTQQAPIDSRVVIDSLGRPVVLPERIDRAVSLAPNLTEMIFAVGAGDRLVGVTTYCNFPAETKDIPKVGDTQTPNIEGIIALQPQVVFVSTASQLESFTDALDERGIAVFVTDAATLDDVFRHLLQLGEIFGTSDNAGRLVNGLQDRVAKVRQETAGSDPVRVFLQISNEPLFTIGKDSFLTDLTTIAGGFSVTKDVPGGYPKLSKETASAMNPDIIILSDSEDNKEPNIAFQNSAAVGRGKVFRIDPDIISRPGPRSVDALETIAELLRR